MIPQQTMMKDASPFSLFSFSISSFFTLFTSYLITLYLIISTDISTRQDAQINYLSTLSIFVKQTTYLATLPNPKASVREF